MAEISDEKYEELRQILERRNSHAYTLEEAKEIGDGLIDFFNLLIELEKSENDSTESLIVTDKINHLYNER